MSLKMKKIRINSAALCIFIAIYVYFVGFFITYFEVSESVLYLSDVLLMLTFLIAIKKVNKILCTSSLTRIELMLIFLLICGTLPCIIAGGSIERWIWALRNWGRFFIYFVVGISVLSIKDLEKFYDFTLKLFHINTVVIVFEFLFMRNILSQDQLNGLVGRNTSSTNIILILSAISIMSAKYFSKQTKLKNVLIVICEGLLVSVLAELKAVIFFIFMVFFFVMFVNMKLTKKQIIRLIFFATGIIVLGLIAVNIVTKIYPRFANILTIQGIYDEIANPHGYGFSGKIDRLTAIKVINEDFFNQRGLYAKLFGLGIGNAEYSSLNFLKSDFYNQNGSSYGYLNFTVSMVYLETGYVGLILFTGTIVMLLIIAIKWLKYCNNIKDAYMFNIGIAELFIVLLFIIYNNLQRTDMSLLLAIYVIAPWVAMKSKRKKGVDNEKNTSVTGRIAY